MIWINWERLSGSDTLSLSYHRIYELSIDASNWEVFQLAIRRLHKLKVDVPGRVTVPSELMKSRYGASNEQI